MSISAFYIKYVINGADQIHKMMADNAFQAESKAKQLSAKIKSDVSVWSYPAYGVPVKLCTIIYK
jgi:hypothetical protein